MEKDHRKCHTGENAILRERCFPGKTEGDQTAGEQSTFNAVEDIQKNTVQRKRKIQNGKLSEGIVPEGLFFEKNRNRAVFLGTCCARRTGRPSERDTKRVRRRQYRMQRQRQRGGLWKDRKARQGRKRPCARTVPKAGKRRQCRLILAKIPCRETVVIPEGRMPSDKSEEQNRPRLKRSRVPIKSALKKRKMEAEKESITTMPHPAARQIFARLESFLARYDATKRESTVCMPPAPRESISA